MSILDFAEDPTCQFVGVALSKDDVTVLLNVKPDRSISTLECAIVALQNELNALKAAKTAGIIQNKPEEKPLVDQISDALGLADQQAHQGPKHNY